MPSSALLQFAAALAASSLFTNPPGRENGEAQKEKTEVLLQPTPGKGLLYTGWPWSRRQEHRWDDEIPRCVPFVYRLSILSTHLRWWINVILEGAIRGALGAASRRAFATVQVAGNRDSGLGAWQVGAVRPFGTEIAAAGLVRVLHLGEADASCVLRIPIGIPGAHLVLRIGFTVREPHM